jgi:antitoxin (DNA-binding transcriptional repressor) of toxin-antitoxin stability system
MKFLSVRDLRSKSADVWKGLAEERELVVTSNGRPIAILSVVTEDPRRDLGRDSQVQGGCCGFGDSAAVGPEG